MSPRLPSKESPCVVVCGDAIEMAAQLPDDSVDLLVTSPPYEKCRTYGLADEMPSGEEWVAWMVKVIAAWAPKVKGLMAINCEGQTRGFRYSCVPFLLTADLHRTGFNLRKPVAFRRVGIPGSGGPDWLRNDWEPVICITRPGKLPWSDNTACGHTPKWAPGGEMSHRQSSGARVNQWGHPIASGATVVDEGGSVTCKGKRPSHRIATKGSKNGDTVNGEYVPPAIANPGNVLQRTYTAEEVAELMGETADVLGLNVGGGAMGDDLAHLNEAPFPEGLPDFFIRSFCPPGGLVADCFCGSGTTAKVAVENRRRFFGADIRQSQVDLTLRRLASGITPDLFAGVEP